MICLLVGSLLLNVFLVYAWLHDTNLAKQGAYRYKMAYHKTLDHYAGEPPGSTSRRLAEGWPEGSHARSELESMAGELERGEVWP